MGKYMLKMQKTHHLIVEIPTVQHLLVEILFEHNLAKEEKKINLRNKQSFKLLSFSLDGNTEIYSLTQLAEIQNKVTGQKHCMLEIKLYWSLYVLYNLQSSHVTF